MEENRIGLILMLLREGSLDHAVKVYQEEGWWRVIPVKEGLDILTIIKKHKLEPLEKYFARSTRCQNRGRINKKLAPKPKK